MKIRERSTRCCLQACSIICLIDANSPRSLATELGRNQLKHPRRLLLLLCSGNRTTNALAFANRLKPAAVSKLSGV